MAARLIAGVAGTALLCGSVGIACYIGGWDLRQAQAGGALTERAQAMTDPGRALAAGRAPLPGPRRVAAPAGCVPPAPAAGALMGLLEIPAVGLRAPVVEGEGDGVLADAVGHDISSVPPGDDGTAVLAAHDVTYFGSLPSIRPGQVVRYFDGCDEHVFVVDRGEVVRSGSPVPNSLTPTLVLDTCWPVDALWWTPDRYLVLAHETSVLVDRAPPSAAGVGGAPRPVALSVPVPAGLAAQGLGIDDNVVALGTLTVSGHGAAGLVASPVPLDIEAAAMTAYFAGLHALAEGRLDWWHDLAPGVPVPQDGAGATISEYGTRLDVTVLADGDHAAGADLQAWVVLAGGPAPGTYDLQVATQVRGGELVVTGWSLRA